MSKVDFITMAEDTYVKPLLVSVAQVKKFYPEATFYIYDCGLSPKNAQALKDAADNVVLEKWTIQFFKIRNIYTKRRLLKRGVQLIGDSITRLLQLRDNNPHADLIISQHEFEIKIRNKLEILRHHNHSVRLPFIFIDADAFIIDRIDELLDNSFDVGLTLRGGKLDYRFNFCRLLNVGVMLFLGTYAKNTAIIEDWAQEANRTKEAYNEQSSLSRLLLRKEPQIFEKMGDIHNLDFAEHVVRVKILNSKIYNNTQVQNYLQETNKHDIKVLHFKIGKFNKPYFEEIVAKL